MDEKKYKQITKILNAGPRLIQGDTACAYGAMLAGCGFFAGYPITPATETAEAMADYLPLIGGTYIQMEDEIASIAAVIGASWTGVKSMTATSGPGFSLMQENIGYACMTETPCVVVDVQRSGPSTGQPTEPAQGDMLQAKWGSHGDYEMIALCPNSVQECMDHVILAFNLSEKYRNPVIVLTDGEVGHMREKITVPEFKKLKLIEREQPDCPKEEYVPFGNGKDGVPPMALFGSGYRTYVTGLTHKSSGLPSTDSAEHHTELVERLCEKIRKNKQELQMVEELYMKDAEYAIVCYGITSRVALSAVRKLRRKRIKVGFIRLICAWPFPDEVLFKAGKQVKAMLVPEMNLGQMIHPISQAVKGKCKVFPSSRIGGQLHTPEEIVEDMLKILPKKKKK